MPVYSCECKFLYIAETVSEQTRISKSQSELAEAISDFKKNYENFAMNNPRFILIDDDLQNAFTTADAGDDVRHSAQLFGSGIKSVLRTIETKNKINESKWTTRVGNFMTKLYPVARLSLSLVEAVGNVLSNLQKILILQGLCFSPLGGAADGLGIILQVLSDSCFKEFMNRFLITKRVVVMISCFIYGALNLKHPYSPTIQIMIAF
jgi:hypothetical protein